MAIKYSSSKTELKRTGNPHKNGLISRDAYYTDIYFEIDNKKLSIPMKIDTGATYTVIGTYNQKIEKWRNIINNSSIKGKAFDASDTEIELKGYIINNFRLTPEIVFPKIRIFFSDALGSKAILGMDILSLFDFQYKHEKGNMLGTFWINNYEQHLQKIESIMKKKNLDYLDTEQIFLLDEVHNTYKVNIQDLEATTIYNRLNQ